MARMIDALKIACGMLVCSLFVFACLLYTQDAYADESTQDVSLASASSGEVESDALETMPVLSDGDDPVDALPEIDEGDEPQEQQQPEGLSDGKLSLRALEGEEGDEPTVHEDGWADEDGFTYYYVDGVRQTGWIVDTTYKDFGLQRYWINPYQGCLVFDCLIDAADAGYWAYARPEGYVVRGWYQAADGSVYLADDDGKLEDPGWLITDDYAGGLQRYYIDEATHACKTGFFEVYGSQYYGELDAGYVVRSTVLRDGAIVSANNDGVLFERGWLVDDVLGYGLQRYWFDDCIAAMSCLIDAADAGYWAYARPEGYVVRGWYQAADGSVYLADNDGKLEDPGWLVSSDYAGGLQRYYIDEATHACTTGFFEVYGSQYYGLPSTGYVLRGKTANGDGMLLADNDGRLSGSAFSQGWLVTDLYDGHLERYYLDYVCSGYLGAKVGFFAIDGYTYYGSNDQGFELRNIDLSWNAYIDNDGAVCVSGGTGWVITAGFGQDLQRYWFKDGVVAAGRLIPADECGWWAYATKQGYVVRGKAIEEGLVYLAADDGELEAPGWLVSYEYEPAIQRYYIDPDTHACVTGFFEVDGSYYLGLEEVGYVLRGNLSEAGKSYYADDDGRLSLRVSSDAQTTNPKTQASINSSFIGSTQYLFLPSHADITAVILAYEAYVDGMDCYLSFDGEAFTSFASGSAYDITAAQRADDSFVVFCKTSQGAAPTTLMVMISASVASLYLVSDDPVECGRSFIDGSPDHSTRTTGRLLMVDSDGTIVYNNALTQIKGRGNTTWIGSEKKPYQIKLDKKTDLLETGNSANKAKTWVLLANAFDSTMMRNGIFDDIALELGLSTSPENRPVDLYYDGEYRGSYLLCEKVEVKSGRVDMFDLEEANEEANPGIDLEELSVATATNSFGYRFQYVETMNTPEDYTGGYLIELDDVYYAKERCWFETSIGHFSLKTPENLSYSEMLYISMRTQEMIGACHRNVAHLSSLVDIDSFAKVYLVNEFSKNTDWGGSSTYFFLPTGDEGSFEHIFYAGPVWDADNSMGLRNDQGTWSFASYAGLYTPSVGGGSFVLNERTEQLIASVFEDDLSMFLQEVLLGGTAGSTVYLKPLSSYVDEISQSAKMNYTLWTFFHLDHCIEPYSSYEQNVSYLETWLSNRAQWFAGEISTWPKSDIRTYATWYGGIDYALVYDYAYYIELNPDVQAAFGDDDAAALEHFIVYGMSEGRIASRLFNVGIYRDRYGDLQDAFGDDLQRYYRHFIRHGFGEGRIAV